FIQTTVTGHLVRNGVSLADGRGGFCFNGAVQRFVTGFSLPVPLLDTQFGGPLADGGNGGLECRVREQYGTQHFVFSQFLSLRFHHQYGVFGTSYNHVQQRVLQLAVGWVQQVAIFFGETHTGTTDRAVKRNTGHGQCGRGRDHGADIRINVFLGAHNGQQHLNFVHEAFREQRTNRTVDQTGSQGFFFGRTALTLQVTTRNTTGSVHFFLVMHGQREEILTGFYAFSGNNSGQHLGFAHGSQYGTIGLTGDTASFQSDGFITELEGFDLSNGFCAHRVFSFLNSTVNLTTAGASKNWLLYLLKQKSQ